MMHGQVSYHDIVKTSKYFATVLVLLLEVKVQFVGFFKGSSTHSYCGGESFILRVPVQDPGRGLLEVT